MGRATRCKWNKDKGWIHLLALRGAPDIWHRAQMGGGLTTVGTAAAFGRWPGGVK